MNKGKNRGKTIYVPKVIIDEAKVIAMEKALPRADAMRELVKYSRVGREVERIARLDWSLFTKKKRKKR